MKMNELKRHKKSDKIKWVFTGIAFVLVFVFVAGLCMQLFGQGKVKPSEWFKKPDAEQMQPDEGNDNEMPVTAALSFAAPCSMAMVMTADVALLSSSPNTSLGVVVSDSDFSKLSYNFNGYGSYYFDNVLVGNNLNTETRTDVLFVGGMCPAGSRPPHYEYFALLPKVNVFTDLGGCEVIEVVAVSGEEQLSPLTTDSRYYLDDFYVFNLENTSNDFKFTYNLVQIRNVVPLPPNPVKEGHTFVGWYYDSALTQPYKGEPIYEDTQLYAKFELNRYSVIFNSDGGSLVETQTVEWNTAATLTVPTRDGYVFKGWYMPNGTKYENQGVTDDITLTAHWEIKIYTVSFYVDGVLYTTIEVEHGSQLLKVANEQNLVVMSVFSESPDFSVETLSAKGVTTDLEVTAAEMDGADKVVNTVKNNTWAVIGGVAGGVAFIAIIAAICGSVKSKKKR